MPLASVMNAMAFKMRLKRVRRTLMKKKLGNYGGTFIIVR